MLGKSLIQYLANDKTTKTWGFKHHFEASWSSWFLPSYTGIAQKTLAWRVQSKTSATALTNNVSTGWPHQRERVGKNKQKPSFNSFGLILTSPSHKINTLQNTFPFFKAPLFCYSYLAYRKHYQVFIYIFCMLLVCSNGVLKISKQVFGATPHSLIRSVL